MCETYKKVYKFGVYRLIFSYCARVISKCAVFTKSVYVQMYKNEYKFSMYYYVNATYYSGRMR